VNRRYLLCLLGAAAVVPVIAELPVPVAPYQPAPLAVGDYFEIDGIAGGFVVTSLAQPGMSPLSARAKGRIHDLTLLKYSMIRRRDETRRRIINLIRS
jgi:hypothetical protein